MNRGFFPGSQLVSKAPPGRIPKCGACGLHLKCQSPKMHVAGLGQKKILIIGDAPHSDEDKQGVHFVDKSGQLLRKVLSNIDVDLDDDCWSTNSIICFPGQTRVPSDAEIGYCSPNLMRVLDELKPNVIIPLGGSAVKALLGAIWRENPGPIGKWRGWRIPCQRLNAWVCPTFHPSYCLQEESRVLDRMFEDDLERACEYDDRPWRELPKEKEVVELIYDSREAARIIDKMIAKGGTVAFDYETNMLKPDSKRAEIICCSVCWGGKKTIAYPWHGEAIAATRRLLRSELWKVGSNIKFEERWSIAKLDTRVRNWRWCTMIGAHIMDNRQAITSVKFQSFVLLGSDIWNNHIEQFLYAEGGVDLNEIKEQIDLSYFNLNCGIDSLLEYRVAEKQLEILGYQKPEGMR